MYPGDIERLTMVHRIHDAQRDRTLEAHRLQRITSCEHETSRLGAMCATILGICSSLLPSRPVSEAKTTLHQVPSAR